MPNKISRFWQDLHQLIRFLIHNRLRQVAPWYPQVSKGRSIYIESNLA
jgi:hypothetical protein